MPARTLLLQIQVDNRQRALHNIVVGLVREDCNEKGVWDLRVACMRAAGKLSILWNASAFAPSKSFAFIAARNCVSAATGTPGVDGAIFLALSTGHTHSIESRYR